MPLSWLLVVYGSNLWHSEACRKLSPISPFIFTWCFSCVPGFKSLLYRRGVLLDKRDNSTHNTPTSYTSSEIFYLPKWKLIPPEKTPNSCVHYTSPHLPDLWDWEGQKWPSLKPPKATSKPLLLLPALKIPGYEVPLHIPRVNVQKIHHQ